MQARVPMVWPACCKASVIIADDATLCANITRSELRATLLRFEGESTMMPMTPGVGRNNFDVYWRRVSLLHHDVLQSLWSLIGDLE